MIISSPRITAAMFAAAPADTALALNDAAREALLAEARCLEVDVLRWLRVGYTAEQLCIVTHADRAWRRVEFPPLEMRHRFIAPIAALRDGA